MVRKTAREIGDYMCSRWLGVIEPLCDEVGTAFVYSKSQGYFEELKISPASEREFCPSDGWMIYMKKNFGRADHVLFDDVWTFDDVDNMIMQWNRSIELSARMMLMNGIS